MAGFWIALLFSHLLAGCGGQITFPTDNSKEERVSKNLDTDFPPEFKSCNFTVLQDLPPPEPCPDDVTYCGDDLNKYPAKIIEVRLLFTKCKFLAWSSAFRSRSIQVPSFDNLWNFDFSEHFAQQARAPGDPGQVCQQRGADRGSKRSFHRRWKWASLQVQDGFHAKVLESQERHGAVGLHCSTFSEQGSRNWS